MPPPDPQCTCVHVQSNHFELTGRCQVPNCPSHCPKFELGVHVRGAAPEAVKPIPNET